MLWPWWTPFLGRRSCALLQQAATGSVTSPCEGRAGWCAHVACICASTEGWSVRRDEDTKSSVLEVEPQLCLFRLYGELPKQTYRATTNLRILFQINKLIVYRKKHKIKVKNNHNFLKLTSNHPIFEPKEIQFTVTRDKKQQKKMESEP